MLNMHKAVDIFKEYYAPDVCIEAVATNEAMIETQDGVRMVLVAGAKEACKSEGGIVFSATDINDDAFGVASSVQVSAMVGSEETIGLASENTYVIPDSIDNVWQMSEEQKWRTTSAYLSAVVLAGIAMETGLDLGKEYIVLDRELMAPASKEIER